MAETELKEKIFGHYRKARQGNYIIDIKVPNLNTLFDPFDPSPISNRDINPEIIDLIIHDFVVFDKSSKVELNIHLPKRLRKDKLEPLIETAIRNQFEYHLLDSGLHMQRRIRKGLKTLLAAGAIFITLFTSSFILGEIEGTVIIHLLAEGLAVGAWVSLWHPIEMLLYEWLPLYEEKKKYSSLLKMKITFAYIDGEKKKKE